MTETRKPHRSRRRRRSKIKRFAGPALGALAAALFAVLYWFLLGPGSIAQPPATPLAEAPAPQAAPVARSTRLKPVSLPRDDGPHATATEWWYYNGHLSAGNGRTYSFHAVVFLRDGAVRHTVFHGSLNEYRRGSRYTRQLRTAGVPKAEGAGGFNFEYEDWRVAGKGAEHQLKFGSDEFSIELSLSDEGKPVLHQALGSATPGILDFGKAGSSYYYSRPRMKAHGTLGITGAGSVPVEGEVWFDHQWGNFEASRLAWNWFALQLDDGSSVMLYQLFDKDGKALALAGTHTGADGRSVPLDEKAVSLTPEGVWRSAESGIRYPAAWKLRLPQGEVELKPLRQDSEFNGLETTFAHYWEGGVAVSGALGGVGFVEMSGYDHVPQVQPADET